MVNIGWKPAGAGLASRWRGDGALIRSFLGLPLPGFVRDALAVQQQLLPLPSRVDPETLHLTLAFLGAQSATVLEDVDAALGAIRVAPFALSLRGFGLFGGDRPRALWAGLAPSPALTALQEKVEHAVRRAGVALPARRFVPHVTLGRFAPPAPEQAMRIERAVAEGAGFRAGPWEVREMVLWESRLSPKGAHYIELARYSLA